MRPSRRDTATPPPPPPPPPPPHRHRHRHRLLLPLRPLLRLRRRRRHHHLHRHRRRLQSHLLQLRQGATAATTSCATSAPAPLLGPESPRATPRSCEAQDQTATLLSRQSPPRSVEASRARDRPEPGTGRGQARRLPGQPGRRAPVAACGTPPFSSAASSWRTRAVTGKRHRASGAGLFSAGAGLEPARPLGGHLILSRPCRSRPVSVGLSFSCSPGLSVLLMVEGVSACLVVSRCHSCCHGTGLRVRR